jgi:hypothetical protein
MITQADLISRNDKSLLVENAEYAPEEPDETQPGPSNRTEPQKPTTFGSQFPTMKLFELNEQSPIRPSKYFADDSAINTSKGLRKIIIGGIVFSVIVTLALIIQMVIGPNQVPNRIGIVTQEARCSEIGADMVRNGGNSVDAFIASQLCLSVVNPFVAGVGAGGFLMVRDHKHGRDLALNCFFKASASLNDDKYKSRPTASREMIAVPGELKCLQYVYHKYAR